MIALKDAKEIHYWLRFFKGKPGYLEETVYVSMVSNRAEHCKLLFSIIKATRIKNIRSSA
jgi:hypothetical protein